jgi:eukaryotic translation initiation factor 2-alpha kinase 4
MLSTSTLTSSERFFALRHVTFVVYNSGRFPKTYPSIACPTFTILQPIKGIPADRVAKLTGAIHAEAQKLRGSEMVFQVRPITMTRGVHM